MKFTMTKIAAAAVLATAAMSAQAAPQALLSGSNFKMYNPTGTQIDANGAAIAGLSAAVTGFIDTAAGTWGVGSTAPFNGLIWTASGGTLYTPGTYTVNVNGDGALGAGAGNMTFTVGAGQLGGNINFAWGTTTGIDVFNVWNVTSNTTTTTTTTPVAITSVATTATTYTSSNINALANSVFYNGVAVATDTILGLKMVDGPFQGFNANFNMNTLTTVTTVTPVPEASTYGMMLAGLGLVGFAVRRRKFIA